ncbi:protein-disulfide reductase DsbD family protein [Flavobacterium lindanitolerans]|uniref:Thiol:disulfide interchange protein DsbD n=1 Tax=Flavobacterium lindanitolerans TaxID=428988 RepID=A0A497UI61_9FLAO|nr:thioredoxin family protein [Flavobacterium lindanitolerans]PKW20780.1 thiol:disulfide interchange protein DsbD [Flavobacterium lindanitolerans]RLJ30580.1 thiol:disulfide interchange protein DsbD [Flavobacterium lindanitolerans]
MKKISLLLFFFFALVSTHAQILDPVKWTSKIEKISDTEYLMTFDGVIEPEWHMYSQFTPEGGVNPLEVLMINGEGNFEATGKAEESKTRTEFNDIFKIDEIFFENTVQLKQKIKIINKDNNLVQIELSYQVCKKVCIQQNKYFEFDLKNLTAQEVKTFSEPVTTKVEKKAETVTPQKPAKETEKGLLTIFLIAFFSGFAALLTPCVFPMIPMTVSFFTKQSKTKSQGIRNAILYGVSIILIYVILGSLVTAIFGADALNALSTNVWFNIIFFILLVFFAASFLGAFEIVLPNSWANKVDRQADRGGFIGIFFMALALAIVSFSCTGPIVGSLLVEAASKGGIAPIVGMVGFSLALALPFMLFALFPGWMNSLPKSGGWLNTVKVSLGFLELAFAFKFLSKADLVMQTHLLEREVFLAIWIAVFGAWAFYLFGKITLPHDSPLTHISVGRFSLGLLVLSFTIYLIPGLWGAPLKIISGFPPSITYSESPYGVGNSKGGGTSSGEALPEGAKLAVHDIVAFTDYDQGVAYAKKVNKPILLDFTGFGCENCRKMEDFVWSDNNIQSILKNDVVLISLYVDEKQELAEAEKYVSKETGRKIKTKGNKWSDFQITRYKANAQPYYIILDSEGNDLNEPVGYTPDKEEYEAWLKSGISKHKKGGL